MELDTKHFQEDIKLIRTDIQDYAQIIESFENCYVKHMNVCLKSHEQCDLCKLYRGVIDRQQEYMKELYGRLMAIRGGFL